MSARDWRHSKDFEEREGGHCRSCGRPLRRGEHAECERCRQAERNRERAVEWKGAEYGLV